MGYYYHGVTDMADDEELTRFIKILKSGELKTRQEIRDFKDNGYDHVCLYRKNPEFGYNDSNPETMLKSARAGWIDHSFVFIISPDIDAEKTSSQYTNLVDEWRSHGPIPFDKIVALGIPFDGIEEFIRQFPECHTSEYQQKLDFILDFAQNMGWRVINSDEKDFCDKLDKELDDSKLK